MKEKEKQVSSESLYVNSGLKTINPIKICKGILYSTHKRKRKFSRKGLECMILVEVMFCSVMFNGWFPYT